MYIHAHFAQTLALCLAAALSFIGCGEGFSESMDDESIEQSTKRAIDNADSIAEKIRGGSLARKVPDGMMSLQEITAVHPDGSVDLANRCGGTLIRASKVLTADHCIKNHILQAGNYVVCAGQKDTNRCKPSDYAFVTRVSRHRTEDVAVLHLDRDITGMKLAKLAKGKEDPSANKKATAFGYGMLKGLAKGDIPSGAFTNKLHTLSRKVVSNQKCKREWQNVPDVNISPANICLAAAKRKGVCSGDSGGPIFFKGKQVGIASFVSSTTLNGRPFDTCTGAMPDVFVRVSKVLPWINRVAK